MPTARKQFIDWYLRHQDGLKRTSGTAAIGYVLNGVFTTLSDLMHGGGPTVTLRPDSPNITAMILGRNRLGVVWQASGISAFWKLFTTFVQPWQNAAPKQCTS